MIPLSKDEQYALGAVVICFAAQDDSLRDLSADDRAIALRGRRIAYDLLITTGIQPTALKELGIKIIEDAKARP